MALCHQICRKMPTKFAGKHLQRRGLYPVGQEGRDQLPVQHGQGLPCQLVCFRLFNMLWMTQNSTLIICRNSRHEL